MQHTLHLINVLLDSTSFGSNMLKIWFCIESIDVSVLFSSFCNSWCDSHHVSLVKDKMIASPLTSSIQLPAHYILMLRLLSPHPLLPCLLGGLLGATDPVLGADRPSCLLLFALGCRSLISTKGP